MTTYLSRILETLSSTDWLVLIHDISLTVGVTTLAIVLVQEAYRWCRRRWNGGRP